MTVEEVLKDLREERDLVEHAILILERFAATHQRRGGRPPAWTRALEPGNAWTARRKRGRPQKAE